MTKKPPKLFGFERPTLSFGEEGKRTYTRSKPQPKRRASNEKSTRKSGGGGGRRPPKQPRRRSIKWVIFRLFITLGIWFVSLGLLGVLWFSYDLPDINRLQATARRPSVTIMTTDGTVIGTYGDLYEDMIRVEELSPYIPQALMAIEDRRFYSHFGVDIIGLVRAAYTNYRADRVVQGGSTITQQLAKNFLMTQGLYTHNDRSLRRKIQEAIMAVWFEWHFTKDQIMTIYLNRVYFGAGTYGVDAAAHKYFKKSARQLTVYEAAVIAGLLKAPSRYSPTAHPERARARAKVVLDQMQEAGYIRSADEYLRQGMAQQNLAPSTGNSHQFFADWVYDSIPNYVTITDRDLVVIVTLDLQMQKKGEEAALSLLAEMGKELKTSEIALVAMSPDGAVRAMVGGKNYQESQFNRVTQAFRQPGSAWKPFVYLAALEYGMTPESRVSDEPVTVGNWTPRNFGKHKYRYEDGEDYSLKEAITKSVNSCTVRLAQEVGTRRVAEVARRLGISGKIVTDLSMAIGTTGTTLLELTAAIGTFANNGMSVWPYGILAIRDKAGNILYQRTSEFSSPVVDLKYVKQMNQMLISAVNNGTGRAAKMHFPVAGKTGSNGDFDAWFVGYTPDLVAGVWTGNDNFKPMAKKSTGARLPARTWGAFMKLVYDDNRLPQGELPVESSEMSAEMSHEDVDEISDDGPIAPRSRVYTETDDEFERLVNQIAG
ncbi:MAG: PBP1A family penicillin-binding protein [Alphaproteobacteria bacterium]|nr:PBP1A family penicillin-binding protein [Alphaproteobacteria bacterium]